MADYEMISAAADGGAENISRVTWPMLDLDFAVSVGQV
jgi:hypothetical protein